MIGTLEISANLFKEILFLDSVGGHRHRIGDHRLRLLLCHDLGRRLHIDVRRNVVRPHVASHKTQRHNHRKYSFVRMLLSRQTAFNHIIAFLEQFLGQSLVVSTHLVKIYWFMDCQRYFSRSDAECVLGITS